MTRIDFCWVVPERGRLVSACLLLGGAILTLRLEMAALVAGMGLSGWEMGNVRVGCTSVVGKGSESWELRLEVEGW